jgi:hypothetical protein
MSYFAPKEAASFGFKDILYEKKDWVGRITINRPESFNCYTTETLKELITAFEDASNDDAVGEFRRRARLLAAADPESDGDGTRRQFPELLHVPPDLVGEILQLDPAPAREDYRALHDVLQFAHIARKGMPL